MEEILRVNFLSWETLLLSIQSLNFPQLSPAIYLTLVLIIMIGIQAHAHVSQFLIRAILL